MEVLLRIRPVSVNGNSRGLDTSPLDAKCLQLKG